MLPIEYSRRLKLMQATDELNTKPKDYPYDTLNSLRKFYLLVNWLVIVFPAFILISNAGTYRMKFALAAVLIALVAIAFAIWIHLAVCNRKVDQLFAIAVISLLSLNIVGFLIILWIRKISKIEQSTWKQAQAPMH